MANDKKNTQTSDKRVILTDSQKSIISECVITAHWVVRIPTIANSVYDELSWAFRVLGGNWSDLQGGFVFANDPTEAIKKLLKDGEYIITSKQQDQENKQFFKTQKKVARRVVGLCELEKGDVVLEPSAGHGNIIAEFPESVSVIAVEFSKENYEVLLDKQQNGEFAAKDIKIHHGDFLQVTGLKYNKVVMNPPFSNFQDLKHVVHAYSMLEKGGILVAIIGANSLVRSQCNKEAGECVEILRSGKKFEVIPLPSGSFTESGTNVDTVILKIQK